VFLSGIEHGSLTPLIPVGTLRCRSSAVGEVNGARPARILYTFCTHSVHLLHALFAPSARTLCTFCPHSLHLLPALFAPSARTLCTFCPHSVHLLHALFAPSARTLCTFCLHSVHLLHALFAPDCSLVRGSVFSAEGLQTLELQGFI
jgi:hypothetical protein